MRFFACIYRMKEITARQLHEHTDAMLDLAERGRVLNVIRDGRPVAVLVPANAAVDLAWDEILVEVRQARLERAQTRPNPILAERRKRQHFNHAR
jgi:antitoxin (DNA-binding transcriptional repressor) of toxin-antitoxin stability system